MDKMSNPNGRRHSRNLTEAEIETRLFFNNGNPALLDKRAGHELKRLRHGFANMSQVHDTLCTGVY